MELSEQERERIRQEEFVRWQVRNDIKLRQRARLILPAVLWAVVLTVLGLVSPHLHWLARK
jgi:hypothetical protein